jgi:hypothetical protein
MPLRRVAVFAGSESARIPEYHAAALRVGALLARSGITLLAEGITTGLAHATAEAARDAGGVVIEMPRDAELVAKAEAFLALPQGLANLDELFQLWSWQHKSDPEKPAGLLNVAGHFSTLLRGETDAAMERFARETQRGLLIVENDPETLLGALADFRPPETRRHLSRDDS